MLKELLKDNRNREQLSEIIEIENNYTILEFFSTKKSLVMAQRKKVLLAAPMEKNISSITRKRYNKVNLPDIIGVAVNFGLKMEKSLW